MSQTQIAKRYAKALFLAANAKSAAVEVDKQLQQILLVLNENPDLELCFQHPQLAVSQRRELLCTLIEQLALVEPLRSFLELINSKRRVSLLREVVGCYHELWLKESARVVATVTSATALAADQQAKVADILAKQTGKSVEVCWQVDPELIGGILIKVGDNLIDATVVGRLQSLGRYLKTADGHFHDRRGRTTAPDRRH